MQLFWKSAARLLGNTKSLCYLSLGIPSLATRGGQSFNDVNSAAPEYMSDQIPPIDSSDRTAPVVQSFSDFQKQAGLAGSVKTPTIWSTVPERFTNSSHF